MKYYLDFEEPIRLFDEEIHLKESLLEASTDVAKEIAQLHEKRLKKINKIHSGLNRWQRVQLARHPQRPYSLDYIDTIFTDFVEIHGDRLYGDDPAVVSGFAKINKHKIAIVAQQKGRNTKENLFRNFGMMRPEGYRKTIRLMNLANKFNIPIISFIDTPGAYPGVGAEERGQAEAIAKSIECCMELKVPTLAIIIGEGGSGGAIALASSNKVIMLENAIYSVISPEGCATILWRDPKKMLDAAKAMKLSAKDLLELKVIDEIIREPLGGAHRDKDLMLENLRNSLSKNLEYFKDLSPDDILNERKNKFLKIGRNKGFINNSEDLSTLTIKESNIIKNLKLKKIPILIGVMGIILLISILLLF